MLMVSLFFFEICELKAVDSVIYEAAAETAEYMAEYSYLMGHIEEVGVTDYPMAAARFIGYVDDRALLEKYVTGGVYGVMLMGSEMPDENGVVEIKYTYHVKVNIPLLCNFSKLCTGSIRQCAYIGGGKESGSHDTDTSSSRTVFVADGSVVYHCDSDCTYLRPSVSKTDLDNAIERGYSKCRYCGAVEGNEVYITNYGEVYHSTPSCSRISRNIREVDIEDIDLPPCSKCGH